ncbi:hypothetical protein CBL_05897 [Carabus blaptoides fortunei]
MDNPTKDLVSSITVETKGNELASLQTVTICPGSHMLSGEARVATRSGARAAAAIRNADGLPDDVSVDVERLLGAHPWTWGINDECLFWGHHSAKNFWHQIRNPITSVFGVRVFVCLILLRFLPSAFTYQRAKPAHAGSGWKGSRRSSQSGNGAVTEGCSLRWLVDERADDRRWGCTSVARGLQRERRQESMGESENVQRDADRVRFIRTHVKVERDVLTNVAMKRGSDREWEKYDVFHDRARLSLLLPPVTSCVFRASRARYCIRMRSDVPEHSGAEPVARTVNTVLSAIVERICSAGCVYVRTRLDARSLCEVRRFTVSECGTQADEIGLERIQGPITKYRKFDLNPV